jgi:hypothetical protein
VQQALSLILLIVIDRSGNGKLLFRTGDIHVGTVCTGQIYLNNKSMKKLTLFLLIIYNWDHINSWMPQMMKAIDNNTTQTKPRILSLKGIVTQALLKHVAGIAELSHASATVVYVDALEEY